MSTWNVLADDATIVRTVEALQANGITVHVVDDAAQAKAKALELIPQGSEVMTMSSQTNEAIGLNTELNDSGKYDSVKKKFAGMDPKTQQKEMNALGAAPDYTVGSVHAITQDGRLIIVSNTGSQLPAYAYACPHVIWVAGTQKIVASLDDGFKRIKEHVFPLEDTRAQKAYGVHSAINKHLVIEKEVQPGRLTMIIVKEVLGF
jgi:hypothetical protein